jgi:hypothetical protein
MSALWQRVGCQQEFLLKLWIQGARRRSHSIVNFLRRSNSERRPIAGSNISSWSAIWQRATDEAATRERGGGRTKRVILELATHLFESPGFWSELARYQTKFGDVPRDEEANGRAVSFATSYYPASNALALTFPDSAARHNYAIKWDSSGE